MFYCYILYSEKLNQTYIGYTTNLKRRLAAHKTNPTLTTRRSNDYILVWYCTFKDRNKAIGFERYLKSGSGRAFVRKRILGSFKEGD